MEQLLDLYEEILTSPKTKYKSSRGGNTTSTLSRFGPQMSYDLDGGVVHVPTTKKTFTRGIIHELVWLMSGDTNVKYLIDNDVHFWTDNAFQGHIERQQGLSEKLPIYSPEWTCARDEYSNRIKEDPEFAMVEGDLGRVYGAQWRSWKTEDGREIDQLSDVVDMISNHSDSRRLIVSAWNPSDVPNMVLPPCHMLFQFHVSDGTLSSKLTQRSADCFLGVPFNVVSYELMTHAIAQMAGLEPGEFIHSLGDAHLYADRPGFYEENLESLKAYVKDAGRDTNRLYGISDWIHDIAPYDGKPEDDLDHVTAAIEQLGRKPSTPPTVEIAPISTLEDISFETFKIKGYESAPAIKRRMAV